MSAVPVLHRSRDVYYSYFLLSYVPTIVLFDSIPLYPASLVPAPLARTHAWYLSTFRDPLVGQQPPFFRFFTYAELLYQLPTAVFLVRALRCRSPTAPAHLLVWAALAAFTTATCCWEIAASAQMTPAQKWTLGGLYGSYGVFFAVMAWDMFCRLQKAAVAVAGLTGQKKVR